MWETSYIEGAATHREIVRRRDGSVVDPSASNYDPPRVGIHLCGQTDDGQQPTTVARYPLSAVRAAFYWHLAREVAACSDDEADFVVDLCLPEGIHEDFNSNRQLWPRAIDAWNAHEREVA